MGSQKALFREEVSSLIELSSRPSRAFRRVNQDKIARQRYPARFDHLMLFLDLFNGYPLLYDIKRLLVGGLDTIIDHPASPLSSSAQEVGVHPVAAGIAGHCSFSFFAIILLQSSTTYFLSIVKVLSWKYTPRAPCLSFISASSATILSALVTS